MQDGPWTAQNWAQAFQRLQQQAFGGNAAPPFDPANMRLLLETLQRFTCGLTGEPPPQDGSARLRELYDLWIDCAESAYAVIAHEPAFAAAQAATINEAYKSQANMRSLVERLAQQFGLATLAEVDALRERIAALEAAPAPVKARRKPARAQRPHAKTAARRGGTRAGTSKPRR